MPLSILLLAVVLATSPNGDGGGRVLATSRSIKMMTNDEDTAAADRATAFCASSSGGTVTTWTMMTGNPNNVRFGGYQTLIVGVAPIRVCSFPKNASSTSSMPGPKPSYPQHVELDTFASFTKTLASVAYYARVPPVAPANKSLPADVQYCAQVGGTAGNTSSTGWWSAPAETGGAAAMIRMQFCMFADGSAIEVATLAINALPFNTNPNALQFQSARSPLIFG